jgi:2'-5' RNA ligase
VAVWPDSDLVGRLRRMDRPTRAGVRWTTEDQWHVTLRFLGQVDEGAASQALESAFFGPQAAVVARAGPRPLALSDRVWALPVGGLGDLARMVEGATSGALLDPRPPRSFRGHLTLARARRPEGLQGLEAPDLSHEWPVGAVTLVRSELRPAGARYEVIGRWPLAIQGRAGRGPG